MKEKCFTHLEKDGGNLEKTLSTTTAAAGATMSIIISPVFPCINFL